MSRISYSEEEDYPGQFALWRGNLARSMAGKKGQAALLDLRDALLALPTKRLIPYHIARNGEVCATGALVAHRMVSRGLAREAALRELEDDSVVCSRALCGHSRRDHRPGCDRCRVYAGKGYKWAEPCEAWVEPSDEYDEEDEQGETEAAAVNVGVPRMVVWRIIELNDIELETSTPEERYEHVLAWAQRGLDDPDWLRREIIY